VRIDDAITALKSGKFEIDCIAMTLTQNSGENAPTFCGNGYIRQDAAGAIQFKLYANSFANTDSFSMLREISDFIPGTLVPDISYYELRATGTDGSVWTSTYVMPDINWARDSHVIAAGKLGVVQNESESIPDGHSIEIHFFDEADIPCIQVTKTVSNEETSILRDRSEFSIDGTEFRLRRLSGEFTVSARRKEPFPQEYLYSIQEGLRFILAKSVAWRACVRTNEGKSLVQLCSPSSHSKITQMDPPIQKTHIQAAPQAIALLSAYLSFAAKPANAARALECSYHLHNACEASANSIDAWAIGLAVAIEGMTALLDYKQGKADLGTIEKAIDEISKLLAEKSEYAGLTRRVAGLLSMLKRARPQERMHSLVPLGRLDGDLIAAWTDLRNAHVHPKQSDLRDRDSTFFQRKIDLIHRCTTLMYQLAFHIIGYAGDFTDYASPGWPVCTYPLTVHQ
jgi:hypothetical protein